MTPSHILYPSFASHQSCVITPQDPTRSTRDLRGAFLKAQSRINSFWRSWAPDYITLLHNCSKWRRSRKELKEGDLVLVVDDQQPRSTWKLARVIEAVPEVDEHVRKATVKTADKKTLLRDRESLVLLEMDSEQDFDVQDVDE